MTDRPLLRMPMTCTGLNVDGRHVVVTLKPPVELGIMADLVIRQEADNRFHIGQTYTLVIEDQR